MGAAVESALAAVGVELEIIVIDDAPRDASAEIVRELLAGARRTRAQARRARATTQGSPPRATAGSWRRARRSCCCWTPTTCCCRTAPPPLYDALQGIPEAAFAYGFVARCGLEHEDLLGTEAWDPALFRPATTSP